MIRLDKFLADMGVGTRSEVKRILKNNRIRVNELIINDSGYKLNEEDDSVYIDNKLLEYTKYNYYMLNKPQGVVSATNDKISDTVISLLKNENTKALFPVGRLDKDTEGLLLITNNGQVAHNLLSPKKHVDKKYYVLTDKKLTEGDLRAFKAGIDIGDEKNTLPAQIGNMDKEMLEVMLNNSSFDSTSYYEGAYYVVIKEGRYHQIKRMFEYFDSNVIYLKRINMGPLTLDSNLKPGEYRKLSLEEIKMIEEY